MATSTLGSLVVTLEANIAKFQSDIGKAVAIAERTANSIKGALATTTTAVEAMGAAFGLAKVAGFAKSLIDSVDQLQQLHIQTGMSVTSLSALQNEAAHVGMDVDSAALSFDRMQKNAAMAAGGNAKMTAAFKAIGLSAKDVAAGLKDPDQLMLSVARHMSEFADDGNKTAEMMTIFGRGGAQMNELLQRLAENGYNAASATAEQAAQAREFNARLADLTTGLRNQARDVLMAWLPAIDRILPYIKLAGTRVIIFWSDAWIQVKYATIEVLDWLTDRVKMWADKIGAGVALLPDKLGGDWGKAMQRWGARAGSSIAADAAAKKAALAQNAAVLKIAMADYVDSTTQHVFIDKSPQKKRIEPAVSTERMAGMRTEMDGILKVLADSIAEQDLLMKTGNKRLDIDYGDGLMSLQDYANAKEKLLTDNFATTQALYDAEIRVAQSYADRMKGTTQGIEALAKVAALIDAKQKDANQNTQDQITLTEKLTTDQEKLAKSIEDVQLAYYQMNGQTEQAAALQIEMRDGALKAQLAMNGQTDALKKLVAVEQREMLNASQSGMAGVQRALIDYQNKIRDVAKSTQDMTTKMFSGLEDAMVGWVQTGKLNFKSLVDSIIADMARIVIEQSIMGPLISMLGSGLGIFGGAAGGGGGGFGGMKAEGGSVQAGKSYIVGEKGPEWFQPAVGGTIVPRSNSLGSGGGITFAPIINVDSRADRAQVHADVVNAVRQGQRDLLATLIRYNPSLRV